MKEIDITTSVCRYCRFYQPEGRRGGSCQKLGVPVESRWKACALAASPFKTTVNKLEEIFNSNSAIKSASTTSKVNAKNNSSEFIDSKIEQIAIDNNA